MEGVGTSLPSVGARVSRWALDMANKWAAEIQSAVKWEES